MLFKRKQNEQVEPRIHQWFGPAIGSVLLFVLEVVQIFVIAAAIIIPVRYFLVQPFIVKGASMEASFFDGEYLIIDELTYRFREIERGETVVFRPPTSDSQHYIKRVIGLPGETVEIVDGKVVIYNDEYPNGIVLQEEYIDEYTSGHQRVVLGLDEYYFLGDNRDQSLDSRRFGAVKEDFIVGRVWLRGLPFDRMGAIDNPEYNF
jgi:signal peptidase I